MTRDEIRNDLKIDLRISTTALDPFLDGLISQAEKAIGREGITLTPSIEDSKLIEQYAAYLYRARNDGNMGMPRFLRYMLNNRLLSEKGAPPWTTC